MSDITFYTQFNHPRSGFSNSGCAEKVVLSPVFDDKGVMDLQPSGKLNIYDEIQSHKDSVDIHVLLKRYQNGELDVFSKASGVYVDVTNMPTTYAEMLNVVNRAEEQFNSLTVEQRAKFGHSFEQFLATAGTQDWFKNLGIESAPITKDIEVPKGDVDIES